MPFFLGKLKWRRISPLPLASLALQFCPVAQWWPFFFVVLGGFPFKVNQPKKDAFFAYGHWASESLILCCQDFPTKSKAGSRYRYCSSCHLRDDAPTCGQVARTRSPMWVTQRKTHHFEGRSKQETPMWQRFSNDGQGRPGRLAKCSVNVDSPVSGKSICASRRGKVPALPMQALVPGFQGGTVETRDNHNQSPGRRRLGTIPRINRCGRLFDFLHGSG